MGDLLNTFLSSIKYQFSRFLTKFRTITSRTYLKNKVWGKIKLFFTRLFDVRPKHKDDYYGIFRWLISKKLAYLIVIVIGIVSVSFLYNNKTNFFHTESDSVKSYNYGSILLRFAKGNVRIKGKDGYLAYEGNVAKGRVTGVGKLYNHDEQLIYDGEFDYNAYNGRGQMYYPGAGLYYEGEFKDNAFEGDGVMYRENGTLWYRGEFKKGMKDGNGILYDAGGSQIFSGPFQSDSLLYSSFIGKTTEEVTSVYTGKRTLYEGEDYFDVYMQDIDAIYEGESNEGALDDAIKVKTVYVLNDFYRYNNEELRARSDIRKVFGIPMYEGLTNVSQSEAIAIAQVRKKTGDTYFSNPGLMTENVYDDDLQINDFDHNMTVYIESYMYGGLEYTFVSSGMSSEYFGFYYISE